MKYLLPVILIFAFSSCIDFRISEEDAMAEFEEQAIIPVFQSIEVGDRKISYLVVP